MQMLSEFEKYGDDRVGARTRDEAAGSKAARPAAPELLSPPKGAGAGGEPTGGHHTISLTTAYGDVVSTEEVPDAEFGAALRRVYNEAVPRVNAVVVIDGVTHTRNAFLEFVREFNDWTARQRGAAAAA